MIGEGYYCKGQQRTRKKHAAQEDTNDVLTLHLLISVRCLRMLLCTSEVLTCAPLNPQGIDSFIWRIAVSSACCWSYCFQNRQWNTINSMLYWSKVLPTVYFQCLTGQPPTIEGFQAAAERNSKLLLYLTFLCERHLYFSLTNNIMGLESFHQTAASDVLTLLYSS